MIIELDCGIIRFGNVKEPKGWTIRWAVWDVELTLNDDSIALEGKQSLAVKDSCREVGYISFPFSEFFHCSFLYTLYIERDR